MPDSHSPPLPAIRKDGHVIVASGAWHVRAFAQPQARALLRTQLSRAAQDRAAAWDLSGIAALDHIGAQLLWNAWGRRRPAQLALSPLHEEIFDRIEQAGTLALPKPAVQRRAALAAFHRFTHTVADHLLGFVALIGQLALDLGAFAARPLRGPWREISANIFHIGYQALGITALVGFLIGIVLSYLSAQQLRTFGGDIYLVNLLGMSIVRELGPMLAAILVAGRSGSSITAQLGVMRVTEELDAMLVMGMPHGFRLILPQVVALGGSMRLLVVWTDAVALAGGMAAAKLELGLSAAYFLRELPDAVPMANYWIGLGKGLTFGVLIALVACHFGLRVKPDTASLGQGTTLSVVTAITAVIVADAIFAIAFKSVGFY